MFSKFADITPLVWSILAGIVLIGILLYVASRTQKRWNARMLANAAMCIALSFILSYIRLYKMPQGGSITLASMLPIFLFAYTYGTAPGFVAGAALGILQFIQDGYFVHPVELLLDYPLAFAMLGLAGIGRFLPEKWGYIPGIVLGILGRFLCAFLAGVIFFGSYANGQNVFVYSAVYNGVYLIPEALICLVIASIPQVRNMAKQMSR